MGSEGFAKGLGMAFINFLEYSIVIRIRRPWATLWVANKRYHVVPFADNDIAKFNKGRQCHSQSFCPRPNNVTD